MFRTIKVLNNNSVLAIATEDSREVIVLGKGVGFGKKVNERFQLPEDGKVYQLQIETDRGEPASLVMNMDPVYLEITNAIIHEAQQKFGEIDTNILIPLADHIAFAVERMKNHGYLSNPMTMDIKALFEQEFEVAMIGKAIIADMTGVEITEDEVGYIALHIHSSIDNARIPDLMQQAQVVHACMEAIEQEQKVSLDVNSIAYNRLLSHVKYMIVRMRKGEGIELDMNAYIAHQYPETFEFSKKLCDQIAENIKHPYKDEEIGYLAMHIVRVCGGHAVTETTK